MNEQIKERIETLADDCWQTHPLLGTCEFDYHKFAELIVQDCLAEAMDEVQYHADWTLADAVAKRIKEHFGIRW